MKKFLCFLSFFYVAKLYAVAPDSTIQYQGGVPSTKTLVENLASVSIVTQYTWDNANAMWVIESKVTSTELSDTTQLWNDPDWVNESYSTDSLDQDGNLVSTTSSSWKAGQSTWELVEKSEFVYDNDVLSQAIHYEWKKGSSTWKIDAKTDYVYDSDGNLLQVLDSILNGINYAPVARESYTYTNDVLTEKMLENWDAVNLVWVLISKEEYQVDAYGNLFVAKTYEWDDTQSLWLEVATSQNFYDTDGDGITDSEDPDMDNDGVLNAEDLCFNTVIPAANEDLSVGLYPTYPVADSFYGGGNYTFDGDVLSSEGTYYKYYVSSDGCDSVSALTLTKVPKYTEDVEVDLCEGDSLLFGASYIKSSGSYSHTYSANIDGLDSLVNLTVSLVSIDPAVTTLSRGLQIEFLEGSVQWFDCDTDNPIANADNHVLDKNDGETYYGVINYEGCERKTDCHVTTQSALGIFNQEGKLEATVYPNPTSDKLYLNKNLVNNLKQVAVFDLSGNLVLFYTAKDIKDEPLDLSDLAQGAYFIEVKTRDEKFIERVVVQ